MTRIHWTGDEWWVQNAIGGNLDEWQWRERRKHERHAGLPLYRGCPMPDGSRTGPEAKVITSAMLKQQRAEFARATIRRAFP